MDQSLYYESAYDLQKCIDLITGKPQQFQCKWGTPLWYEAEKISADQVLIAFTGGQFRKSMKRTQYLMEFLSHEQHTLISLNFQKELYDLPAMTTPSDIDLCMEQKLKAINLHWDNTHWPQEIVKLVGQAHRHESFNTNPHISVSSEMRQQLMYPLTQSQVLEISNTQHTVEQNNFEYELSYFSYYNNAVTVVVLVTIDYHDPISKLNIHHNRVPLFISATRKNSLCYEIVSVTHK